MTLRFPGIREPGLLAGVLLAASACHDGGAPITPPPITPPPATPPPTHERAGVLVTYQHGTALGQEHWQDDGHALVSELTFGPQHGRVTVTRALHTCHVHVEAGEHVIDRDLPDGTVALENGSWQAYALAAEGHPADGRSLAVQVMVPSRGAIVAAQLTVRAGEHGRRRVELTLPGMTVTVEVSADGAVTHAMVPAQGIEALPEGVRPAAPVAAPVPAGVTEEPVEVASGAVTLRGTLSLPVEVHGRIPVVVLVAGSGPTDRDGNGMGGLHTDAYRLLAHALALHGVATVRYDKRGVGRSGQNFNVEALTLEDFIADASAMVAHTRADVRLGPLTLAGHSEGGVIALRVAAHTPVDALLLLASPGRPMGVIVREQLARQADAATMAAVDRILGALRAGTAVDPVPQPLAPLFNPTIRTFLRSELDVDPVALLHGLTVRTTVVQGETDAQVTVGDARALAAARPDVRLVLLPQTNHVLKTEATAALPQASYTDPMLPLAPGVLDAVLSGVAR